MTVTVKDYAAHHGVCEEAVRRKIRCGTLQARKMDRVWILDDDTPYIDHRRTRQKAGSQRKRAGSERTGEGKNHEESTARRPENTGMNEESRTIRKSPPRLQVSRPLCRKIVVFFIVHKGESDLEARAVARFRDEIYNADGTYTKNGRDTRIYIHGLAQIKCD